MITDSTKEQIIKFLSGNGDERGLKSERYNARDFSHCHIVIVKHFKIITLNQTKIYGGKTMGQIANQMLIDAIFKLKEKIKNKKQAKNVDKNADKKENKQTSNSQERKNGE